MSRAGALIGVTAVVGLMLLATSVVSPGTVNSAEAHESNSPDGAVTIRSGVTPEQATWQRLRWMIAGVGIAAVILVSVRQLRVMARHRFASDNTSQVDRQRIRVDSTLEYPPRQPVFDSPVSWVTDASPSVAGD
ncbi:hypothetical protein BH23CHL2_BH23CHL2_32540 [soil metagenome]